MARIIATIKEWVGRYQITIINVSLTVLLIIAVIVVLLSRFSALQRKTAEESIVNLAGMTANEVQSEYLTYFDTVRTVSQIMKSYETIAVDRRRTFFDDIMHGILSSSRALVSIYTIWKPNTLDNRDADFINTPDSGSTGQYITGFTRENGWIEKRAFAEYADAINNFPDYVSERIGAAIWEPYYKSVEFRKTWVFDIQVPIMQESLVVGMVGVTINLDQLQKLIESKNPYNNGRSMVISRKGNILAHYHPNFRGLDLINAQIHDTHFSAGIHEQAYEVSRDSMINLKPAIRKTTDTLIVSYSLSATNPRLATFANNETTNPPWAVVTMVPMSSILGPLNYLLSFSISFIIGAGILVGVVFFTTSRSLTQQAKILQQDLERATTMQDNVKYGLFLMDQKYVIQGAYSKALEKILSVSNLQGKVFIELLASSIRNNEQHGLADYFEMVFNRSFDAQMLENINPISDFTYTSITTGETKSLHTNFTLAEWGRGTYILGTLEDVTAEKELEKQLANIERKKEKEMQSLFQVVQINPRVLKDFIQDTEYEFNRINEFLKNNDCIRPEIMVNIYQSIHAIKSNALILNLEDFSSMLHKLESSIKEIRERKNASIEFDDVLDIVLELNEVLKEKDHLESIISRLGEFMNLSANDDNAGNEYVLLTETLAQACQKAQAALHKKAKFIVEKIDEAAFKRSPRRVVKEVLTQLVRNAVYHGIETPGEREAMGKNPEGEIRLSINMINENEMCVQLEDDGRGIDFKKIREKAKASRMLEDYKAESENENEYLLQLLFLPGFSTISEADMHGGRGVGLSLVKDRIKDLGGNIAVTTAPNKGTAFTIIIPACDQDFSESMATERIK